MKPAQSQINSPMELIRDKEESAMDQLESSLLAALETYSNVHRGSGHFSQVTTHLFEKAREIILNCLNLPLKKYVVIFCSPRRSELLIRQLKSDAYQCIRSQDVGLAIGIHALAVKKKALSGKLTSHVGGGTTQLVSTDWVIWANTPDRFEAGTPAIIHAIALAKVMLMRGSEKKSILKYSELKEKTAKEILYRDELDDLTGTELLYSLRSQLIGKQLQVPSKNGPKTYTHLDNGASTPTFTPIWNTFRQTMKQSPEVQNALVEEGKTICMDVLNASCQQYEVIFTSNTTEAINLVAESFVKESSDGTEPVILSSYLEHSSNDLPWRKVANFELVRLSVDDEGFLDLQELEDTLSRYNQKQLYGNKRIRLVALSGASNVLGSYNPLDEISRIVHQYDAQLLVDAAQMIAHRKVDMNQDQIDYLAFSGHKVYAPFGCGVLMVKKGMLHFDEDEMQRIKNSGEENKAGIAALSKSLLLLKRIGFDIIQKEEQQLTAYALQKMEQIEGLKIYGVKQPNSTRFVDRGGVISFHLNELYTFKIAQWLAEEGTIGVRSGCHCAHILVKDMLNISQGLERFQWVMIQAVPKLKLPGVVRISLGIENTVEDIDRLIASLVKMGENSKSPKSSSNDMKKAMKDFIIDREKLVYGKINNL